MTTEKALKQYIKAEARKQGVKLSRAEVIDIYKDTKHSFADELEVHFHNVKTWFVC